MKKSNKNKKIKKYLIIIGGIIIALVGGAVTYSMNKLNHVDIDKSDESLGITTASNYVKNAGTTDKPVFEKYDEDIINIALFGLDRRDIKDSGRADATMILTIDFKHNKLKLSSLMRDMYIDIEGYKKTKFNHAYSYGGAPLAIKTINQNFGTDIKDYATVDFFMLEQIIDKIDGVKVEVDEEEFPLMNNYMNEVATIKNEGYTPLVKAGLQTLDGKQAVAYARIRKVGNGDFERTERQRIILTQMIEQVSTLNKLELTKLVLDVLPYIETSLDTNTILDIAVDYLAKGIDEIEQTRFPKDGYWNGEMINKVWYMQFNLEETKNQLQDFIYQDGSGKSGNEEDIRAESNQALTN